MTTKEQLHELVEGLTEEDARRLHDELAGVRANPTPEELRARIATAGPAPLTLDDLVLAEPILPDDETADDMIATIQRWRHEGGYV